MHSFYNLRVQEYEQGILYGINLKKIAFDELVLRDLNISFMNNAQGCYIRFIRENVLPYFKRSQIHIVIQERMFHNTQNEVNNVSEFLGVSPYLVNVMKEKKYDSQFRYTGINYNSPDYRKAVEKLYYLYEPYNIELFKFLQKNRRVK